VPGSSSRQPVPAIAKAVVDRSATGREGPLARATLQTWARASAASVASVADDSGGRGLVGRAVGERAAAREAGVGLHAGKSVPAGSAGGVIPSNVERATTDRPNPGGTSGLHADLPHLVTIPPASELVSTTASDGDSANGAGGMLRSATTWRIVREARVACPHGKRPADST